MCCRLTISPLNIEMANAILLLGEFVQTGLLEYHRDVRLDEYNLHRVIARLEEQNNTLRLELSPTISLYPQHMVHRIDAGVYFEIAAKYAEKVNGHIVQLSNVAGCNNGTSERLLAYYPTQPLMWDQVCPGFQEAIMGHTHNE